VAGHAAALIVGEGAPFEARDFDMGLFLIAPHVLHRDHNHAAPKLYAPLTGPHGWRFGPGTPLQVQPAHQPVWNPPFQPHLTKVGPVPFLCLTVRTRDVAQRAQVLPADDWAKLEDLRLA
jgi:Dimethlysulfonioproprionate lyase